MRPSERGGQWVRLGAPGSWGWRGAAGGAGLVLETLTGTRRDGVSPRHSKAAQRRRPEEYRWSENILAPINKLFTRFKKRRAQPQRRAPSQSLVPPGRKPPGRVPVLSCDAEETEQHSAAAREGSRPGSPHRSGFLRLDMAERPADPPASKVHLSPHPVTGSTLCCGEKPYPCLLVP